MDAVASLLLVIVGMYLGAFLVLSLFPDRDPLTAQLWRYKLDFAQFGAKSAALMLAVGGFGLIFWEPEPYSLSYQLHVFVCAMSSIALVFLSHRAWRLRAQLREIEGHKAQGKAHGKGAKARI